MTTVFTRPLGAIKRRIGRGQQRPFSLQQLLSRVGGNANTGAKLNIICHHDVEIVDGLADLLSNPLGRISIGIAEDQGKLVTTKTAGQIRRTLAEGLQKMATSWREPSPI